MHKSLNLYELHALRQSSQGLILIAGFLSYRDNEAPVRHKRAVLRDLNNGNTSIYLVLPPQNAQKQK
jgi:hypothetical protein